MPGGIRMRGKKGIKNVAYAFIAPALISISIFTVLPIVYTIFISFTNYNMYHLEDFSFIGITNYLDVLKGSISEVFSQCWDGQWYLQHLVRLGHT